MAATLPQSTLDLFERPLLCALCTINPDGQPHAVPVWCDFDGANVRVNCPIVSRKARNMQVGSKVTVLVLDPQDPSHWVSVQGHVSAIVDEEHGAREHINLLSQKYTGNPDYAAVMRSRWGQEAEEGSEASARRGGGARNCYVIEPDQVFGQ